MKLKIKINMYNQENCFMAISNDEGYSLFNNIHPRLAHEIAKRLKAYKPTPIRRKVKKARAR